MNERRNERRRVTMRRVRIEAIAAAAFAFAAILTLVWPDWIEGVTGTDPDHGDGTLEWAFVAALGVIAVVLALMSWRDLRVARTAPS